MPHNPTQGGTTRPRVARPPIFDVTGQGHRKRGIRTATPKSAHSVLRVTRLCRMHRRWLHDGGLFRWWLGHRGRGRRLGVYIRGTAPKDTEHDAKVAPRDTD